MTEQNYIRETKTTTNESQSSVYIIKCTGNGEQFYKIGKTRRALSQRFSCNSEKPYDYEVVKTINGPETYTDRLEKQLQKFNRNSQYKPQIDFCGSNTECFSEIHSDTLEDEKIAAIYEMDLDEKTTRMSFNIDRKVYKQLKRLALEKETTVTDILNRLAIQILER